ncbi:MAG: hypothetical protein AAF613_02680 [Pseudomonadota bacterium]
MPDGTRSPLNDDNHQSSSAPPFDGVRTSVQTAIRLTFAIVGLVLIIIGVPLAAVTPFPFIPIGLPVVILGVVLLGRNSVWGRNWMEGILRRWPSIERFAPNWLMKAVFGRDKAPS